MRKCGLMICAFKWPAELLMCFEKANNLFQQLRRAVLRMGLRRLTQRLRHLIDARDALRRRGRLSSFLGMIRGTTVFQDSADFLWMKLGAVIVRDVLVNLHDQNGTLIIILRQDRAGWRILH